MPGPDAPSSPLGGALIPSATKEEALAFYKAQYEQLESELAEFQASSRELEAELEKDVEEAEKRERQLKEKNEKLGFEAEEWKSKCKQSRAEANAAQNNLQKEITMLRESNRSLQLSLRDVEVANDDFERQARHTTSSLEDLESKYNVALERNVILEEEVKTGEQERETLRIELQRLRDELSDLKVEAEIRQDKLRHAEAIAENLQQGRITSTNGERSQLQPSTPERSPSTTASSPLMATPPTKSASSAASDTQTPPSPPNSESLPPSNFTTPLNKPKPRSSLTNSVTPRPAHHSLRPPRYSRGTAAPVSSHFITPARRTTLNRSDQQSLPHSTSLNQIRGLMGKMALLEQRVKSARSRLPAPTSTPPRGSPRPGSSLAQSLIPSNVTVRSSRKRPSASTHSGASSTAPLNENVEGARPSSRLSFGFHTPVSTRDTASISVSSASRPHSRASISSRHSITHRQSISHLPSGAASNSSSRPPSRQSISGTRSAMGHHPATADRASRPRSSIGGSYAASHGHSQSMSVSRQSSYGLEESPEADSLTPTPSRRTTIGREVGSGIPMPGLRKQTGSGISSAHSRRTSSGPGTGDMAPPERRKKLSGLDETF